MARKHDLLTDPRLSQVAHLFAVSCKYSRRHEKLAAWALQRYGAHGTSISACVYDHFPRRVKEALRRLAQSATAQSDHAWTLRPKGVHTATMRQLARLVATRDGSGLYGPQPLRRK